MLLQYVDRPAWEIEEEKMRTQANDSYMQEQESIALDDDDDMEDVTGQLMSSPMPEFGKIYTQSCSFARLNHSAVL